MKSKSNGGSIANTTANAASKNNSTHTNSMHESMQGSTGTKIAKSVAKNANHSNRFGSRDARGPRGVTGDMT